MRAGERGSWSVKYDFTRTLAGGRALRQSMQEARDPSLHVLRSGSAMTVDQGRRSYDCNLVDGRPACTESAAGTALPPSEVFRVAVSVGRVHGRQGRRRRRSPASERDASGCSRPDTANSRISASRPTCVSRPTACPLRQRIVRASGDVDERLARTVTARGHDRPRSAPWPAASTRSARERPGIISPRELLRRGHARARAGARRRAVPRQRSRARSPAGRRAARRALATAAAARRPRRPATTADLAQAPLARTVTYMLIGLIVAVWALASIVTR